MNDNEKAELGRVLTAMADLYGKELSEDVVLVWCAVLKGQPIDGIKRAFMAHAKESEFMPKPADILKRLAPPARTPLMAWVEVEDAIMRHGAYQTVRFADPVTAAVIRDFGGWPWMCQQDLDEPWTQKEFERRYADYQAGGRSYHGALPGLCESSNRAAGYLGQGGSAEKPAIIGDASQFPALTEGPDMSGEVLARAKRIADGLETP